MSLKLFSRNKPDSRWKSHPGSSRSSSAEPESAHHPAPMEQLDEDPLMRLHQQGRNAIILRDEAELRGNPDGAAIVEKVKDELEQRMALVPDGSATLTLTLNSQPGSPEEEVEVAAFLLGVHTVTNRRFQRFVDAGGYDDLEYWPEEIWPHLIELKDQTGQPGPRYWRHGRHDIRFTDYPVVGISWYEAQAFALWIGQRLPTEAEWQMAASWHIRSSTDMLRRYPWGDAMDATRCNLWSSRIGTTVPVDQYPKGAAPNHVLQLVGNVWEWTDTEYMVSDNEGRPIVGEMPMHVIRGGAFDTYFEAQASSHFRTGQIALARSNNTGFRCAMDLSQATWINGLPEEGEVL